MDSHEITKKTKKKMDDIRKTMDKNEHALQTMSIIQEEKRNNASDRTLNTIELENEGNGWILKI